MENRIKAVFILTLLLGNMAALLHSSWALWSSRDVLWLPALLSSASVCFVFLIYIGAGKRPRTSRHLPGLLALTSLSAMAALAWSTEIWVKIHAVGFGALGIWAYVFWYSRLDRASMALQTGDLLPSLSFFNADNELIETGDLEGALLLMFYRGNWCPLCTAQIHEVAKHYQALVQRGYTVLCISPQSQTETRKIADQFSVPMLFCEDRHNAMARKLGIEHKRALPYGMDKMGYSADAVFPTVILTDARQHILWMDQTDNYRVRPEPEDFLNIIDQHSDEYPNPYHSGATP